MKKLKLMLFTTFALAPALALANVTLPSSTTSPLTMGEDDELLDVVTPVSTIPINFDRTEDSKVEIIVGKKMWEGGNSTNSTEKSRIVSQLARKADSDDADYFDDDDWHPVEPYRHYDLAPGVDDDDNDDIASPSAGKGPVLIGFAIGHNLLDDDNLPAENLLPADNVLPADSDDRTFSLGGGKGGSAGKGASSGGGSYGSQGGGGSYGGQQTSGGKGRPGKSLFSKGNRPGGGGGGGIGSLFSKGGSNGNSNLFNKGGSNGNNGNLFNKGSSNGNSYSSGNSNGKGNSKGIGNLFSKGNSNGNSYGNSNSNGNSYGNSNQQQGKGILGGLGNKQGGGGSYPKRMRTAIKRMRKLFNGVMKNMQGLVPRFQFKSKRQQGSSNQYGQQGNSNQYGQQQDTQNQYQQSAQQQTSDSNQYETPQQQPQSPPVIQEQVYNTPTVQPFSISSNVVQPYEPQILNQEPPVPSGNQYSQPTVQSSTNPFVHSPSVQSSAASNQYSRPTSSQSHSTTNQYSQPSSPPSTSSQYSQPSSGSQSFPSSNQHSPASVSTNAYSQQSSVQSFSLPVTTTSSQYSQPSSVQTIPQSNQFSSSATYFKPSSSTEQLSSSSFTPILSGQSTTCFNCNPTFPSGNSVQSFNTFASSTNNFVRATRATEQQHDMQEVRSAWHNYFAKLTAYEEKYRHDQQEQSRFKKEILEANLPLHSSSLDHLVNEVRAPQLVQESDDEDAETTNLYTVKQVPRSAVTTLQSTAQHLQGDFVLGASSHQQSPLLPKVIENSLKKEESTPGPFIHYVQTRPSVFEAHERLGAEKNSEVDNEPSAKGDVFDSKADSVSKYEQILTPIH